MARKKREWYPGATYHVMSRGNRRGAIFSEHGDYLFFLELIAKGKWGQTPLRKCYKCCENVAMDVVDDKCTMW